MFCIKSSVVFFFIAFYIEGESTLFDTIQKGLWENFYVNDELLRLFDLISVFLRLTATFHAIEDITKSLNTFWHELIISFTEFDYFFARLHYIFTDFLISFVMINYNVFDMLFYALTWYFVNDVFCYS